MVAILLKEDLRRIEGDEEKKKKMKKIKKGNGVKGYAQNIVFKRIICKLYLDMTLEMSTFFFLCLIKY